MKKILLNLPDALLQGIDEAISTWGFANRTEFFRFAAQNFLHHQSRLIPSDKTLKEHSLEIRTVRGRQDAAQLERDWINKNRYLPKE